MNTHHPLIASFGTLVALCASLTAQTPPTLAVWDPVDDGNDTRFTFKTSDFAAVATWLKDDGYPVDRVTLAQLREAKGLDPEKYPVFIMSGHLVPLSSEKAQRTADMKLYIEYLDKGGIILGLGGNSGSPVFGTAIEPKKNGGWQMSPAEPRFAWEIRELRDAVGLRYMYSPALHDLDVRHEPTELLRKYWPEAPSLKVKLPQFHHAGMLAGGQPPSFYALYDSLRVDNQPTIPAVFVAKSGKRTAILSNNPGWWSETPPPWFAGAKPLTLALVKLALDLKSGKAVLPESAKRELLEEPPGMEPLRSRNPEAEVNPEGATPLVRWGKFDGTCWELGEPATSGETVDLTQDPKRALPRRLDPGARILLPLSAHQAPAWLRIRFAHTQTDAALTATVNGTMILAEQFIYVSITGESNWGGSQLSNQPAELTRNVFVPPGAAGVIELGNPGRAPVWFDAIQVETHPAKGISPVLIGFYAAASATQPGGKFAVPPDAENWGAVRVDARLQLLGKPEDPNRWQKLDQLYAQYESYKAPIHMIIFGTPEWMAVPESFAEAKKRNRLHICVPQRELFKQAISEWLDRYGAKFAAFELMNEVDIKQFWIGTFEEYVTLCQDIIPLIRQKCPSKMIIAAGSAVQSEALMKLMKSSGMTDQIEWVANHCYAGQSVAWDVPHGVFEGNCFALGIQNLSFANEQGFPYVNSEWFQGPPAWTPQRQAQATDQSMARIMACGQSRVLVFTGGGDDHTYAYADSTGKPRPAYAVVMDYTELNGPEATRNDPVMLSADASLLRGVYVAASQNRDGIVTAVLNPCQASLNSPTIKFLIPLPDARPRTATLRFGGETRPITVQQSSANGANWVELQTSLPARAVLKLIPRE